MTLLFLTGFLQVFFVGVSTWAFANKKVLIIFISGFIISWLWAGNVKEISIGTEYDKIVYAFGAASGATTAFFSMEFLKKKKII